MSNSKINTVNVGGVDFQIQAASGSSDSGFVDDTIEAALKNLIDSFSVDGTYTGRFKATNTPNKWFSYQIDLFDNIASGYIVNTIDPEESYTVRYRSQTDEQATISSIGKTIAEHDDAISQINFDLTDSSSGLPSKVGKSDFSVHVFSLKPPSGTYQTATIDVSKPGLKAIACTGLNSSGNAVVLSKVYGWILDVSQQKFSASFSDNVSAYALGVYILYITE